VQTSLQQALDIGNVALLATKTNEKQTILKQHTRLHLHACMLSVISPHAAVAQEPVKHRLLLNSGRVGEQVELTRSQVLGVVGTAKISNLIKELIDTSRVAMRKVHAKLNQAFNASRCFETKSG
jgi:hypothetical protein